MRRGACRRWHGADVLAARRARRHAVPPHVPAAVRHAARLRDAATQWRPPVHGSRVRLADWRRRPRGCPGLPPGGVHTAHAWHVRQSSEPGALRADPPDHAPAAAAGAPATVSDADGGADAAVRGASPAHRARRPAGDRTLRRPRTTAGRRPAAVRPAAHAEPDRAGPRAAEHAAQPRSSRSRQCEFIVTGLVVVACMVLLTLVVTIHDYQCPCSCRE